MRQTRKGKKIQKWNREKTKAHSGKLRIKSALYVKSCNPLLKNGAWHCILLNNTPDFWKCRKNADGEENACAAARAKFG
jgi:hypothetical protein